MTINQLHKILGGLVTKGFGKRKVSISKTTFRHKLEADGCTILDVESAALQQFEIMDGDGSAELRADGSVRTFTSLVLSGDGESGQSLRYTDWISSKDRLPTHIYSVLGFVTGGPLLVAGEYMIDRVSYDPDRKVWLQSLGMEDAFVPVSHWMDLPYVPLKPALARW